MTLKNVEVLEHQETHKKTWFQKFRNRVTATAVIGSTAIVMSPANAEIPDFLAPGKEALTGIGASLGEIFLIAIGITIAIIVFVISRGGIKKAG
ncbi:MAG: hypothetical protein KAZ18_06425 [Acinetobacter sp.]|nr:hypothetical protein [Acinetobacter sp.]